MIDRSAIRKSFRTRLITVDGYPGDDRVNYENRQFTPPNPSALWLRENFMWGSEARLASNLLELVSMVQFDVFIPVGTGCLDAEVMAKKLGDLFKPGTPMIGTPIIGNPGSIQIAVERAETQKGMEASVGEQVWYQLPVRISFRAYAPNNE